MFKIKKIFQYKNFVLNDDKINNIYNFPNNNILLLGYNLYIYDLNFNLIFTENENIYYDEAYIINNDQFIASHPRTSSTILFQSESKENISKLNKEDNSLANKSFNKKIIINDYFRFLLLYKKNNDLIFIPNHITRDFIFIYDFDVNKNYKCFIKTKIMESPQSNLLLIKDNIFFYSNGNLKLYKLNSLVTEPQNFGPILNSINNQIIIKLDYFDNDNILIIYDEIVKYNYRLNQIVLRIRNRFYEVIVTKNYILCFDKFCYILNKNLELIQIKKNFFSKYYNKGVEINNEKILLLQEKKNIICFKKSYQKTIIFFALRYLVIFYTILFLCIGVINFVFHFKPWDYIFYLSIFVIVQAYNMLKNLVFYYLDNKVVIPSDFF